MPTISSSSGRSPVVSVSTEINLAFFISFIRLFSSTSFDTILHFQFKVIPLISLSLVGFGASLGGSNSFYFSFGSWRNFYWLGFFIDNFGGGTI